MIYKKEANFPFPVLTNLSPSYRSSHFILEDVELNENTEYYKFDINYSIDSDFIKTMLDRGRAELILVIQSKDSKFFKLYGGNRSIKIKKSRISLNKRTSIQLHIMAKEDIGFYENMELSDFYESFRSEIIVPKYSILGFSNIVIFEGSSEKPFELFEKKVDPKLKSAIKIELGPETIIINYRDEKLQMTNIPKSNALNNLYVYLGLQKALYQFIVNNGQEGEIDELDRIEMPSNQLDLKLYQLLKAKMINSLSVDTIDEAIYSTTEKLIEKYADAVEELSLSGN